MIATDTLPGHLAADVDAAFPDLVAAYQDGLFSTALRLTGSAADAEDLAQEALVRAYRALQGYAPHRIAGLQLRAWLWTILLNLARNLARRRARKPPPADLDAVAPPASPLDTARAAVAATDVAAALLSLRPAEREVIVLRYVADLGYDEIAAATGAPPGTVKSHAHRALRRLRLVLGEE